MRRFTRMFTCEGSRGVFTCQDNPQRTTLSGPIYSLYESIWPFDAYPCNHFWLFFCSYTTIFLVNIVRDCDGLPQVVIAIVVCYLFVKIPIDHFPCLFMVHIYHVCMFSWLDWTHDLPILALDRSRVIKRVLLSSHGSTLDITFTAILWGL